MCSCVPVCVHRYMCPHRHTPPGLPVDPQPSESPTVILDLLVPPVVTSAWCLTQARVPVAPRPFTLHAIESSLMFAGAHTTAVTLVAGTVDTMGHGDVFLLQLLYLEAHLHAKECKLQA